MFNKFTRRLATPPHRSPGLICIISQFYCVTSLGTIFSERSPSLALAHSQPSSPFGMNIESHMFSFHVHSTTSLWRFLQSVMKVLHAIQRNKRELAMPRRAQL